MTQLTHKNAMEHKSRVAYEWHCTPWQATTFDHDTGIDLIVQPYDEKRKDKDQNIPPFERRYLVQLKSTETEEFNQVLNQGSLKIDVQHLKKWHEQLDPVMIARYYIKHNCFYFTWIEEVEIYYEQVTQTITLPYRLDETTKEQVKENILEYLIPPDISELIYYPIDKSSGYSFLNIEKARSGRQVAQKLKELMPEVIRKTDLHREIQAIKHQIAEEPKNLILRIELVKCYISLRNINEALSELNVLAYTFSSLEARIISSLLDSEEYGILDSLHEYSFVYYLLADDDATSNSVKIQLDNTVYDLGPYHPDGVIFPIQDFKHIYFILWEQSVAYRRPLGNGIVRTYPLRLSFSFQVKLGLERNGSIIPHYNQVVARDTYRLNQITHPNVHEGIVLNLKKQNDT